MEDHLEKVARPGSFRCGWDKIKIDKKNGRRTIAKMYGVFPDGRSFLESFKGADGTVPESNDRPPLGARGGVANWGSEIITAGLPCNLYFDFEWVMHGELAKPDRAHVAIRGMEERARVWRRECDGKREAQRGDAEKRGGAGS